METSHRDLPWPQADLASAPVARVASGAAADGGSDDPLGALGRQMRDEIARLDQELAEVALLAQQATAESGRHAARSAQTEERILAARKGKTDPAEVAELDVQLFSAVKRGAMMESQVEVLGATKKSLARHRESLNTHVTTLAALESLGLGRTGALTEQAVTTAVPVSEAQLWSSQPTSASDGAGATRAVLGAQEVLRREIARAMHDGPAQSLTNIVLEAQIVERLLSRDPAAAKAEMHRLAAMVQATLDATKSFIFDVRPMVLDDLGLVPTLRRAARDRGRASGIAIAFDTLGPDRRLASEFESAIFRMLDEAIGTFLENRPERLFVRLDWGDFLDARVGSLRATTAEASDAPRSDLPPVLASLLDERRTSAAAADQASARFPDAILTEIRTLAATIDADAELLDDGLVLRLVVPLRDEA